MVFSSTVFLFLFFPVALAIYYNPFVKRRGFRNVFLLLASLFFYGWGEPVFVFLMIASIFITWGIGLRIGEKKGKPLVVLGTVYHVAILFVFKYLTFFANQAGLLLQKDTSAINIALPIGISFFTFQLMSYMYDIYSGKAAAQRNPLNVGLYVALFPQLIAGPIVRYEDIADAIHNRKETFDDVVAGMGRFIYGLGKKVLIANYVGAIADTIFESSSEPSVLMAWVGAIAYTFQIYFDFSGYSDMAIGLGRMFGFRFAENFNYPYISRTVTDFWRRWHISMSSWFRDYVYIPMGGNRVTRGRWVFNMAVVWALTGLWHGANWTFLAWGGVYFGFLILERITGFAERLKGISFIYTGLVVVLAWVIFRANSLPGAFSFIGDMFGKSGIGADEVIIEKLPGTIVIFIIAVFAMTPVFKKFMIWLNTKKLGWIEGIWLLFVFLLSIISVVSMTYSPFIYFNF